MAQVAQAASYMADNRSGREQSTTVDRAGNRKQNRKPE